MRVRFVKLLCVMAALLMAALPLMADALQGADKAAETVNRFTQSLFADSISVENISIGGGGTFERPRIDPFDSEHYIVSCDMGGLYNSFDAGLSWTRVDSVVTGRFGNIVFSLDERDVVYAAGRALYRSSDGGRSFSLLFPAEDALISTLTLYEYNGAYYHSSDNYPNWYGISDLMIDSANSGHLVILMRSDPYKVKVFESYDGGESFTELYEYTESGNSTGGSSIGSTGKLVQNPATGEFVAVFDGSVVGFDRENESCLELYTRDDGRIFDLECLSDGQYLLVDTNDDEATSGVSATRQRLTVDFVSFTDLTPLFMALDNTTSWSSYQWLCKGAERISDDEIYFLMKCPPLTGPQWTLNGILRYDGQSLSWAYCMTMGAGEYTNESWVEKAAWTAISDFTAAHNKLLFTSSGGVYEVTESAIGVEVRPLHCYTIESNGQACYKSTGLTPLNTYSCHVDPQDHDRLLMCCTDVGLLESVDGGVSWRRMSINETGEGTNYINTCYDLEFDRDDPNVVYALFSTRHDAPYAVLQDEFADFIEGWFAVSEDGGRTWQLDHSNGINPKATPVKMSIVYGADGQRSIYVASFNCGFYVSHDGGASFAELNDGISPVVNSAGTGYILGEDITAAGGRVFAATGISNYAAADGQTKPQKGKVFELVDGSWQEIVIEYSLDYCWFEEDGTPHVYKTETAPIYNPRSLEYDEATETLYVGAIGYPKYPSSLDNAPYRNVGGGVWAYSGGSVSQLYDESLPVFGVELSPSGELYATLTSGRVCVYRGGQWQTVVDGLFSSLKNVNFAEDGSMFVATLGGGLYRVRDTLWSSGSCKVSYVADGAEIASFCVERGETLISHPVVPYKDSAYLGVWSLDLTGQIIESDLVVTAEYCLWGDVDLSGELTVGDASLLLRAIVGESTLSPLQQRLANVDASADAEPVTVSDVSLLLRRIVGSIDHFPVQQG